MFTHKRLIKGILVSLMAVIMLNFGSGVAHAECELDKSNTDQFEAMQEFQACQEAEESSDETSDTGGAEATGGLMNNISEQEETRDPMDYQEAVDKISSLASLSHRVFAPLINFTSFQIGNLLGNDYIFHGPLGDMIHGLWVVSRNLVNIAFVFLLLILALKTIFDPRFALDELKKRLLIFTLLLVAVNFSYLGSKIILDASNVVTHAVFAIPSGIGTSTSLPQCNVNDKNDGFTGACVPTAIYSAVTAHGKPYYVQDNSENSGESPCEKVKEDYADAYNMETGEQKEPVNSNNKKLHGRSVFCMENLNLVKYNQNTAVIYMTYGMTRIQNLVHSVQSGQLDQLIVGILMSFILQMVYALSLIILFLALIVRMAMIWLFVGFSPMLVLMLYFEGEGTNPVAMLKDKFDISQFIKWAFVPAKVGAIFTVSFLMITAGQSVKNFSMTLIDNLESEEGIANMILEPKALFAGADSLQTFIWLLMAVAIMWMGVFAVFQDMPIINKVTEGIKGYASTTLRGVGSLAYKAPLLPLGQGGSKKSFEQLVEPFDLRAKVAEYSGEKIVTGSDLHKFDQRKTRVDIVNAIKELEQAVDKRAAGDKIAKSYGFDDLQHMMRMDAKTRKEGFRHSKTFRAGSDQDTRLENLLNSAQRQPKSAPNLPSGPRRPQSSQPPASSPPAGSPPATGSGPSGAAGTSTAPPSPSGPRDPAG